MLDGVKQRSLKHSNNTYQYFCVFIWGSAFYSSRGYGFIYSRDAFRSKL